MSASSEKQIKRLEQQAEKIEKWLSKIKKKTGENTKELQNNVPGIMKTPVVFKDFLILARYPATVIAVAKFL